MADQLHTSSGELTAIIPEIWSRTFYDTLLAKLPFNDSIARDYEGDIQNLGDTVNVSQVPEFSDASELAEGAKADADAVTISNIQLLINKRTYKDFIITKKGQLQSIPFVDKLEEHAAYAIMKRVQKVIIETISPSASAPDHDISFDTSTTLAVADILEAKELLDLQDVPEENRKLVTAVPQLNDLLNITSFVSRDFVPEGSPSATGELSTPVFGFDVMQTSELANTCFFFHPSFMQMAMQQGMDIRAYDQGVDGKRSERVNVDILWGIKQFDNKRVVKIS